MAGIGTENTERIIKKYSDMIYRIAVHNLKNTADAEDIMQEVCIELLTKFPENKDDEYIKAWLIRVTINKCKSFRRLVWQKGNALNNIILLKNSALRNFYKTYCAN